MIRLGSRVTDRITGFSGTVTGAVQYLTGCNQVLVAPRVGDDGALRSSEWLDDVRLIVDETVEPVTLVTPTAAAGFDRAPPRR